MSGRLRVRSPLILRSVRRRPGPSFLARDAKGDCHPMGRSPGGFRAAGQLPMCERLLDREAAILRMRDHVFEELPVHFGGIAQDRY